MQSCCRVSRVVISASIKTTRLSPIFISRRHFRKKGFMNSEDKWLTCGNYKVFVWSIAGLETNVVVKSDHLTMAFDMGYSSRESMRCQNVFISHGHMDHIAAVPQHAAKRNMFGMPKANYYVPAHIVDTLKSVANGYRIIDETTDVLANLNILPISPGDKIQLPNGYSVQTFPTVHRIPSQGYIVYKSDRKLKQEYVGLPGIDVAALHRQGVEIHEVFTTPEIAYLGDTTFEVFASPPTPDLLKVKVLITEATYIEDNEAKEREVQARARGHTHVSEILKNADLFKDVQDIVIMHLSDKYSPQYCRDLILPRLPPSLKDKVHIATLAKDRTM